MEAEPAELQGAAMSRRSWWPLVVGLAMVGAVVPATAVQAQPAPAVTAVSVAPGPFATDGVTVTKDVAVSVHVVEPRGEGAGHCMYPDYEWAGSNLVLATLTRTAGGAEQKVWVHLRRTSGTDNDGTWTGTWHVGRRWAAPGR